MECKWSQAPLDELISYISKGIVPKYTDDIVGSTIVLGPRCVRNQRVDYTHARFHDQKTKPFKPEKTVVLGDILINATGVGSAGRVAQVTVSPQQNCVTDGHVITLRAKGINPFYLGYFLKSRQSMIEQMAEGSTGQTEMNRSRLQNEIVVTFPQDNAAQTAIAQFGLSVDRKIAINNQINGYLAELADSRFKASFGSLEVNGCLSDVAEVIMGQSPAGSSYNEAGDGMVFYQGRGEFGWRYPTQRLFTTEPKRMASEGDVLVSVRAPVGDLNIAFETCCIGRGLAAIHSAFPSYALYLMRSLRPKLNAFNGEGTVFGSINGKALKATPIAVPAKSAIEDYESFAKPIDGTIRCNEQESRYLEQLRDTLLPKLMSGEIDVSKVVLTQLNSHLF